MERGEEESFDLVLLDLRMPGMNGLETLVQIRARRPTLPVVLAAGHGLEHLLREVAGVRAAAVRPYPQDEAALDELLALRLVVLAGNGGSPGELVEALRRRQLRAKVLHDGRELTVDETADVLLLDLHRPIIDAVLCYLCLGTCGVARPMWIFPDKTRTSGHGGDPMRSLAVTGCLFKPFGASELAAALAQAAAANAAG